MSGSHMMFIRHGETAGNSEQIAHGQTESPLNERGVEQVIHTAKRLERWHRPYQRIYCSPMQRTMQTAELLNDVLQLPLETHDGLKEGFLGD